MTHQISGNFPERGDSSITKILSFGNNKLDFETRKTLLMCTIELTLSKEGFICLLFV